MFKHLRFKRFWKYWLPQLAATMGMYAFLPVPIPAWQVFIFSAFYLLAILSNFHEGDEYGIKGKRGKP